MNAHLLLFAFYTVLSFIVTWAPPSLVTMAAPTTSFIGPGDPNPYMSYCFAKEHAEWLRAVDFNLLPKRPFWLGVPFLGLSESVYHGNVLGQLANSAVALNRLLSPKEKEALLPTLGQNVIAISHIHFATPLLSCYFVWRGRRTYRFPLYSPTFRRFNPDYFPVASRWTPIRGSIARGLWHVTRTLSYSVCMYFVVATSVVQYLTNRTPVALLEDPGSLVSRNSAELAVGINQLSRADDATKAASDQRLVEKYTAMFPDVPTSRMEDSTANQMWYRRFIHELAAQSTGCFTADRDSSPVQDSPSQQPSEES